MGVENPDPIDAVTAGPKVPAERVIAAVPEAGITYAELGMAVGVSKDTATRYVKTLGDRLVVVGGGPKQPARVYRSDAALHSAAQASAAPPCGGVRGGWGASAPQRRTHLYRCGGGCCAAYRVG